MSSLKRVEIKGFRSIKEMTLDLRPLNVLIGANGAGKSWPVYASSSRVQQNRRSRTPS